MRTAMRHGLVLVGSGAALLALTAPAAGAIDPPGNNGTVKIDGVVFDDLPDNEPHVGCVFQVDFYGFDEGDLAATVKFTLVPPTANNVDIVVDDVPIGEDAAGGGTDLDASATYDLADALADVQPHSQQGIHLRLTVHADGSQGADTKFKEFWVTGCGAPESTTTTVASTTTTQPGGTTTTQPGGTTTTQLGGTTTTAPGGPGTTAGGPPSTGGVTIKPAAGAGPAGELPTTGSSPSPLVIAGLALSAVGAGIGAAARRLTARSRG